MVGYLLSPPTQHFFGGFKSFVLHVILALFGSFGLHVIICALQWGIIVPSNLAFFWGLSEVLVRA
jgi:hypothetical protein